MSGNFGWLGDSEILAYLSQKCKCGCGDTATVSVTGLPGYFATFQCIKKLKPDAKIEDTHAMDD